MQDLAHEPSIGAASHALHDLTHEGFLGRFPARSDEILRSSQHLVDDRLELLAAQLRHAEKRNRLRRAGAGAGYLTDESRQCFLRETSRFHQREEFPQMIHGNSIDVESFPSKLAECVEEDRGDELRLAELARDHLEGGIAPFLDELTGLLLPNPIFSGEPRDPALGVLREVLADPP